MNSTHANLSEVAQQARNELRTQRTINTIANTIKENTSFNVGRIFGKVNYGQINLGQLHVRVYLTSKHPLNVWVG